MPVDDALALIARCRELIDSSDAQGKALLYAGARAGVKAEQIAGGYPEPSGKPLAVFYQRVDANGKAYMSKFKSQKQQGKVFSLIKRGKIPYSRKGKLGASITSRAQLAGEGLLITVGTNLQYAPWVIGKAEQSHYHAGTWIPLLDKLRTYRGEIVGEFGTSLRGYMAGYLKSGGH